MDCSSKNHPFELVHFFIIINNLLDNTIENCQSYNQKQIRISIYQEKSFYCIEIQNSIIHSILKNNPNFITTKDNSDYHGIGIKSIKLILKKYNGKIIFDDNDHYFLAKVIVPIKEKETKC